MLVGTFVAEVLGKMATIVEDLRKTGEIAAQLDLFFLT